jgi:hypothetical protein
VEIHQQNQVIKWHVVVESVVDVEEEEKKRWD